MESAAAPSTLPSRDRLLALGLAVAGLALRLPFLAGDQGWFDEHYSIITSTQSAADIIRNALLEQTNPPGYYLLAHVWGRLGDASLAWHRVIPATCGALVPAVSALALRRFGFSRPASAAAAVLLLVAPVPWNMSLEVRGYATLALLAATALFVCAGIVRRDEPPSRRAVAPLALLHVAMVLLHYFGAFAVLGVSLAVADHARRHSDGSPAQRWLVGARTAMLAGAPAALVIAAWITLSLTAFRGAGGQNVEWIPETGTLDALRGLPSLMLANFAETYGSWISRGILLAGTALAGVAALRDARARHTLLLTLVPVSAALALNAAGGNDIWVPRYVAVLTPALAMLVATVVDATGPRWRLVSAIAVAAWFGTAGVHRFGNRVRKPDWGEIIAALAPRGEATICADRSFVGLPFIYQSNISGRKGIVVINAPLCRPGHGITWLVYDVESSGVKPPPQVPGLVLGPRIALFRGMQNLDARRVIARYAAPR